MILEQLQIIDEHISLAINSFHCQFGDYAWQFFSNREAFFPLYAIILITIYKRLGWKKASIMTAAIILAVVACDQLANLFKDGVGRLRPCYNTWMLDNGLHVLEKRGGFFGFFSAHSATAFALAITTSLSLRMGVRRVSFPFTAAAFAWAGLVAVSRVFAGKHFFGDILVGMFVGIAVGWCFFALGSWATKQV